MLGFGALVPLYAGSRYGIQPLQAGTLLTTRAVGMFRQSGGIIAVSITTALLAHSTDPGHTQAHTFTIFAAVLLLIVAFTFLVPDHRGSW